MKGHLIVRFVSDVRTDLPPGDYCVALGDWVKTTKTFRGYIWGSIPGPVEHGATKLPLRHIRPIEVNHQVQASAVIFCAVISTVMTLVCLNVCTRAYTCQRPMYKSVHCLCPLLCAAPPLLFLSQWTSPSPTADLMYTSRSFPFASSLANCGIWFYVCAVLIYIHTKKMRRNKIMGAVAGVVISTVMINDFMT
jgi:hypothetical protein